MHNKEKTTSKSKSVRDTVISIAIGLIIAGLLKTFVIFNIVVPTESMETTILTNDKLFGSRLSYLTEEPERGDIITFDSPDSPGVTYVKRIIGLPGEILAIVDGEVYINGSETPLDEPYVNPKEVPVGDFGPYEIPEGCYFVMGDNRNHSLDSRFWETTNFVTRDSISSKVVFRYLPNFEVIESPTY